MKQLSEQMIESGLLAALRDCSYSTLRGFVDKGNPSKLLKLSVLGFVKSKDGGYVVTQEGLDYMKAHRREIDKL